MQISKEEKSKMILLVKDHSNWELYLDPNFHNTVFSLAKEGSGASDSIFGSISYYQRYIAREMKINPAIKNHITAEGYEALKMK